MIGFSHEDFLDQIEQTRKLCETLCKSEPIIERFAAKHKVGGVYIFSEQGRWLYAGRTGNVKQRLAQHRNSGSRHNQAVFAFKLAREATGNRIASYSIDELTRKGLIENTGFSAEFLRAKKRVSLMQFRFLEVSDPLMQHLLETYCVAVLGCPYNDFDNH